MIAYFPLPIEQAAPLEQATGATTLFYGRIGANTVWGFLPKEGKAGVALTDGKCGQVVINVDNLRQLLFLLELEP